jgi:hypothetical protein
VKEGDAATFYCTVAGNPFPKVAWYKDNVKIIIPNEDDTSSSRDTSKYRVVSRRELRILEVFNVCSGDAGLYRITIENSSGRTQASARLDTLSSMQMSSESTMDRNAGPNYMQRLRSLGGSRYSVPPQFSKRPTSTSIYEGSQSSLSCDIIRGSSVPRCQWFR